MPSSENTLYSQGVKFCSFVQGVDARTGYYTSSIALYEAPAKARNCAPFKLFLRFSPLNTIDVGFGKGWSLNLSQYQHIAPRSLVLSTGEHYQIEGLSNAHNVYDTSVPAKLYAANGRALSLIWKTVSGQPRLIKVQDGEEVLLEIKYHDLKVEIVHSAGTTEPSIFTVVIRDSQLQEFWLPLKDSTKWKSSGVEEVTYDPSDLQLPLGDPYKYLPVVKQHIIKPGNQQPAIKMLYDYDVAAGRVPDFKSVGSDIIFDGVGNLVGRGLSLGTSKAFKSVSETLEQLLIGAE